MRPSPRSWCHRGQSPTAKVISGLASVALAVAAVACVPSPPPQGPPVIDSFEVRASPLTAPAVVPLAWTVHDPNGDPLTCRLDRDGDGTFDVTLTPCPATASRNVQIGVGTHSATLEVSDPFNPSATTTVTYEVGTGPTAPFVITVNVLTPADQRLTDAVSNAIERWQRIITRALPPETVHAEPGTCGSGSPAFDGEVSGLVVNLAVVPLTSFAGVAAPCVNGSDALPRLSFIHLDANGFPYWTQGFLNDLVAHELGHALGFTGPAWWEFREDAGANEFWFTGPRAMAAWSELGGSGSVPLSNGGDHWNQPIFQFDLMTCYLQANSPVHPISVLTVAAMADIGHHVNLSAAEPYAVPPEPGVLSC